MADQMIEKYETTIRLETEFLADRGISQELFEFAQKPDGELSGVGFTLPTVKTMERFGIGNVSGGQSGQALETLLAVTNPKYAAVWDAP